MDVTWEEPADGLYPATVHAGGDTTLAGLQRWLAEASAEVEQRLAERGAVVFRGFPVETPADFDGVVGACGWENFPYERSFSNAVRVNKTPRVFTANEAPQEMEIFLHHEMAQTPVYPARIFFCCLTAPDAGGQTPLCRSDALVTQLEQTCPEFLAACRDRGLKYSNVMPPENDLASGMGRSWRSTLSVDTRRQAEDKLATLHYQWKWLPDDSLRVTTPTLPAVLVTPEGKTVFFNQLIAAFRGWKDTRNDPSQAIRHGDDSALDREAVTTAIELAYQLVVDLAWQAGDVALVDNRQLMHGRRPFQGSRTVLASLVSAQENRFEVL